MWLIGRATEQRTRERWHALRALSTDFLDVVRGLPTLRSFNRGGAQAARIAEVSERHRRATMGTLRLTFLSGTVLELAATLGVALVAVTVGVRLVDGGLGLQAGLTVLVLAPELYLPLRRLGAEYHASADGLAVADRMLALLDAPAAARAGGHATGAEPRGGAACGSSASRSPIRRGPAACSTGSTSSWRPARPWRSWARAAAGKSTVAALLLGFLRRRRPAASRSAGSTSRTAGLQDWRALVAWVPQHPALVRGSVADNIRLGAAGVGPRGARRRRARRRRRVRGRLPSGYATLVGDGGRPLSPGERRRIGLARAFLGDPSLVILDEPTADLDPASVEHVSRAVRAARRRADRAAHRPPTRARRARRPHRAPRGRCGGRRAGAVGGVTATLGRLLALADAPRPRAALAAALGALTVILGAGLMATAGYLISRASERPAILSLTVAIVGVRFFGLSRPLTRYFERLASHDLALRVLGTRARARLSRDRAAGARAARGLPARRPAGAHGRRRRRAAEPAPARRRSAARRGCWPARVLVGVAAAFLPAAGLVLAAGLLAGGIAVPALAGWLGRRGGAAPGRRPRRAVGRARRGPARRAGARRLRRRERRAGPPARPPMAPSSGSRAATPSWAASPTAPGSRSSARPSRACSPWRCARQTTGTWTACSSRCSPCSRWPPSRRSSRWRRPRASCRSTLAAGGRVLELADREAAVVDPARPVARAVVAVRGGAGGRARALRPRRARGARRGQPAPRAGLPCGARGPQRRREDDGRQPAAALPRPRGGARDARGARPARVPPGGRPPRDRGGRARTRTSSRRASARTSASRGPVRATRTSKRRCAGRGCGRGSPGCPTGSTPPWGRRGASSRAASDSGSCSPGRCSSDAPVLVLDEPTAHLDPPTARALVDDVFAAAGDRSVLLITHRAEGLDLVDEIIPIG